MMNTLTRLIKPALAALLLGTGFSAHAINWANCAKEGETCFIPENQPVLIRYGSADTAYFYYSMSGVPKFTCNNFNGDPSVGKSGKSCSYAIDNLLGFTDNTIQLNYIAKEKDTLTQTTQLRWVHYGLPRSNINNNKGTWWNTVQAETWTCGNDAMNYDPTKGQPPKKCYQGMPVSVELLSDTTTPNWVICGNENTACVIPTELKGAPIILRYGYGKNWTYRMATLNTTSISCETKTFDVDPIKANKRCEFVKIKPKTGATVAQWTPIIDNDCGQGTLCNNSILISSGTTYDTGTTNTSEWSSTVTASVESGGFLGMGNASLSASTTYAKSSSYSTALSRSMSQEKTASCAGTQSGRMVMYQFGTTTSANCLKDGSCDHSTATVDVKCVMNPPAGYKGPQCLPGYCAPGDDLCQTCSY